jgi:uncharacterized protein
LRISQQANGSSAESLCLVCGLCCNGVLFADLELQPEDSPVRLQALGLCLAKPRSKRGEAASRPADATPENPHLRQPCAAFDGGRCRIYEERPKYCREFECLLLLSGRAGRTDPPTALRLIRTARQRVDKVRRLLRELGDTDEQTALAARFRRTARRVEKGGFDELTADTYAELTLAVHDLNLMLSGAFYPGDGTPAGAGNPKSEIRNPKQIQKCEKPQKQEAAG